MNPEPLDPPIVLVPYDPAWPARFAAEQGLLAQALRPWLAGPIEHIGSTAVPGLPAKPVIDIMAAVSDLASSRDAVPLLAAAQYCYAPYHAAEMHWFCKPRPEARTHHLHLVPYRSALWAARLAFRDQLRRDPALARSYLALKQRLARAHAQDRDAYTEGKTTFIRAALSGACRGTGG